MICMFVCVGFGLWLANWAVLPFFLGMDRLG